MSISLKLFSNTVTISNLILFKIVKLYVANKINYTSITINTATTLDTICVLLNNSVTNVM